MFFGLTRVLLTVIAYLSGLGLMMYYRSKILASLDNDTDSDISSEPKQDLEVQIVSVRQVSTHPYGDDGRGSPSWRHSFLEWLNATERARKDSL